ncbi:uncharacterized protein TNCT_3421 [Trichonephila clavata]|uniref:Gustatory receptor n=1 Tax=Trichonephila clavata TaxID=2740835 RepID=A0A8X6HAT5_TRICU|nr:uncharacterized protein TNCT_3421 [Trichonephila clavata]
MKGLLKFQKKSSSNVHFLSSRMKPQNKIHLKLYHINGEETFPVPRLLYKVLYWTGLIDSSKKTVWNRMALAIFTILLHFACFDIWYVTIKEFGTKLLKIGFSYLISYSLIIVVWYTSTYKRKHTRKLLLSIKEIKYFTGEKTINLLVILFCILPITLAGVVVSSKKDWNDGSAYSYGYNAGNFLTKIIIFYVKTSLYYLIYPTYSNIVVLLYCTLCLRCCEHFNLLSQEIDQCAPEAFGLPKQLDILKRRAKTKCILITIQDTFSLPVMLIMIENVIMCGSIIGWFLIRSWDESTRRWKTEAAYYGINAFLSVVSIFWVAGTLPIAMNKFKENFHSKTHARLLYYHTKDELYLKGEVLNEPDFVLTGCEIVSYRRNTILAFAGTLLTYTILLMNADSVEYSESILV